MEGIEPCPQGLQVLIIKETKPMGTSLEGINKFFKKFKDRCWLIFNKFNLLNKATSAVIKLQLRNQGLLVF